MVSNEKRESLRISSVEDLHLAIQYFNDYCGIKDSPLLFPDLLTLVSLTLVQTKFDDGSQITSLIFSDEWPNGAIESEGYQCFKTGKDWP